jgi:hypothetical protein
METHAAIALLESTYGVRIKIVGRVMKGSASGSYIAETKTIYIMRDTDENMISTMCHEVGHALCHRFDCFRTYHSPRSLRRFNLAEKARVWRSMAFTMTRAERFVDEIGAELCALHFPWVPYPYLYSDPVHLRNIKKEAHEHYEKYEMCLFYSRVNEIAAALECQDYLEKLPDKAVL